MLTKEYLSNIVIIGRYSFVYIKVIEKNYITNDKSIVKSII